jgi:hypothetical protein
MKSRRLTDEEYRQFSWQMPSALQRNFLPDRKQEDADSGLVIDNISNSTDRKDSIQNVINYKEVMNYPKIDSLFTTAVYGLANAHSSGQSVFFPGTPDENNNNTSSNTFPVEAEKSLSRKTSFSSSSEINRDVKNPQISPQSLLLPELCQFSFPHLQTNAGTTTLSSATTPTSSKRLSPSSSSQSAIHHCVMCGKTDVDIPTQNKNICKQCDSAYWLSISMKFVFKFCKGCKNFFPLSEFKDKPEGTKCYKCRERGRTNYLIKKQHSGRSGTPLSSSSAMTNVSDDLIMVPPASTISNQEKLNLFPSSSGSSSSSSQLLSKKRARSQELLEICTATPFTNNNTSRSSLSPHNNQLERKDSSDYINSAPNSYGKPPKRPKATHCSTPATPFLTPPMHLLTLHSANTTHEKSSTNPLHHHQDKAIALPSSSKSILKKFSLLTPQLKIACPSSSLDDHPGDNYDDEGEDDDEEEEEEEEGDDLSPVPAYYQKQENDKWYQTTEEEQQEQLSVKQQQQQEQQPPEHQRKSRKNQKQIKKEYDDWQWDPSQNPLMQLASILVTASASPSPREPQNTPMDECPMNCFKDPERPLSQQQQQQSNQTVQNKEAENNSACSSSLLLV